MIRVDRFARIAAQAVADDYEDSFGFGDSFPPEISSWPFSNVWLGVSCECQKEADERIPHLLKTPAAMRFVSLEPLLGPIDLERIKLSDGRRGPPITMKALSGWYGGANKDDKTKLNWVIVGGESGPKARPMQIEWVDRIIEQCRSASVSCFVKQLGRYPLSDGYPLHLRNSKGGDPSEWPDRLRVQESPNVCAD